MHRIRGRIYIFEIRKVMYDNLQISRNNFIPISEINVHVKFQFHDSRCTVAWDLTYTLFLQILCNIYFIMKKYPSNADKIFKRFNYVNFSTLRLSIYKNSINYGCTNIVVKFQYICNESKIKLRNTFFHRSCCIYEKCVSVACRMTRRESSETCFYLHFISSF